MRQRSALREALTAFGLPGDVRIVKFHGMAGGVFRVELPSRAGAAMPDRLVLRLHQRNEDDVARLRARLDWLTRLRAATGLQVPAPMPAPNGDVIVPAQAPGTFWTLTRWIEGRVRNGRFGYSAQSMEALGELIGRLHAFAEAHSVPPDAPFPLGEGVRLIRGDDTVGAALAELPNGYAGLLSEADVDLMHAIEARVRAQLGPLGQRDAGGFGVVHGDLHSLNVVFHHGEARALDFAATRDYFLWDLAIPLVEGAAGREQHPAFAGKETALIAGYRRIRPLDEPRLALLPLFKAAKRLEMVPSLVKWAGHPRTGIAMWAREEIPVRLEMLRRFADAPPAAHTP